jgi:hypothetical protein
MEEGEVDTNSYRNDHLPKLRNGGDGLPVASELWRGRMKSNEGGGGCEGVEIWGSC